MDKVHFSTGKDDWETPQWLFKVILLVASLAKFLVDLVIHGYSSFKMRSSVTGCMLSYTVPIVFPFSPCTDRTAY